MTLRPLPNQLAQFENQQIVAGANTRCGRLKIRTFATSFLRILRSFARYEIDPTSRQIF